MMNDHDTLVEAFTKIGVKFEECDERVMKHPIPVPGAVRFISVQVAHYHFDAAGNYLGTECNGDGEFVPAAGTSTSSPQANTLNQ